MNMVKKFATTLFASTVHNLPVHITISYYSMRRNESLLPLGFWIISLVGSGIIAIYGVIRVDPILILGQSVGFVAYTRNIALYRKELKTLSHDEPIYE